MKRLHAARRVSRVWAAALVSTLLLAGLFAGPALATEPPAPVATATPAPTVAPTTVAAAGDGTEATSVLQVSPELSLALAVVEGPVRNEADGTYSVTYELVVTQSGEGDIEPLSLLGFTTTNEVVSNEAALEQNAALASQGSATATPTPAATTVPTTTASTATPVAAAAPTSTATPVATATATATPIPEIRVESGLGVAKRIITAPVAIDGAFEFTYEIAIENTGDDALEKLRVVDDLAEVFGADAAIEILGLATDGQIKANNSFDGVDDVELLAPGSTLAAGKMARLSVSVAVVPTELGVYEMNAAAAGVSASGVSLMDVSTDGREVDANDNDDPSDDSEPTALSLVSEQSLELSLRVLRDGTEATDGVFSGTLALTIANPGPFDVEDLQLYEAFADSEDRRLLLESATSDTLSVNPWFDGRTDIALLSGEDSLAIGESGVVVLELTTNFADLQDVQQVASTEGTDPFGTTIKAGTGEILAAAPNGYTRPEAEEAAEDDAVEPAASSMRATETAAKQSVAVPRSVDPVDESTESDDQAIVGGEEFELNESALAPTAVSGALRYQYQVAIAGLIALVLALVGGGTAAGINRRERVRSRQVDDWLNVQ